VGLPNRFRYRYTEPLTPVPTCLHRCTQEDPVARTDDLNRALRDLQASSSDVEACAVVSEDGLIIASSLPQGVEEMRVAAMSAAMLSMGVRTAVELRRGKLEQLFVRGDEGFVVIMNAGPHAVMLALARKEAKLGLLFFDVARAAETVKQVLR
jgi:predicted regulator of Ras-like GTPase activity (Roadblock/LC7/MglB family)